MIDILLILWLTAAPSKPMPSYSLVYEQNWAAGNSTFSQTNVYTEDGHGSPTASGPDALYPEAWEAESVEVRAGRGPAGEATLDWWPSYGDYSTSGFWARVPTVATAGALVVTEGAIEAAYRPNATSSGMVSNMPLIHVFKSGTNQLFRLSMIDDGGRKLELRYVDWWDGTIVDSTHTNTHPDDTWWIYRVEWLEPTYTGDDPNPDGYIRVYENGSLIYEHTSARLWAVGEVAADRGKINGYQLGLAGLFGEVTNVHIYELTDTPPLPPQTGGTTATCCDPPNPAIGPDPVGTLSPWTAACEGGGLVDSVADLTDGENWE